MEWKILQNIKSPRKLIVLQTTVNQDISYSYINPDEERCKIRLKDITHRVVRDDNFSNEFGSCPLKLLLDKSLHKDNWSNISII